MTAHSSVEMRSGGGQEKSEEMRSVFSLETSQVTLTVLKKPRV